MQSQCVLIKLTIKVGNTDNEAVTIECDKCKHGRNPGGYESTAEAPERVHLARGSQGRLPGGK